MVVHGLEHGAVHLHLPRAMLHDVVAGFRLRLGAGGEHVLVALRRDIVDAHLDMVLLAPIVDDLRQRIVGAGHPMVPEAHGEATCGIGRTHIRGRDGGSGRKRRALHELAPRDGRGLHLCSPPVGPLLSAAL
jgi:hypothetical protein